MFRFTIRELVLVTLVAGLSIGCLVERFRLVHQVESWEYRARVATDVLAGEGWSVTWGQHHVTVSKGEQSMIYVGKVDGIE
jgi:hypothetical protein